MSDDSENLEGKKDDSNRDCYGQLTPSKRRVRVNNLAIRLAILKDDPAIHLAIRKPVAKNQIREYEYHDEVTIERTSRSVIFYLKQNVSLKLMHAYEVSVALEKAKKILRDSVIDFMERHPTLILDFLNPKEVRKEVEVKDDFTEQIPRDVLMHDTIFKKVYPKGVEFIGGEAETRLKAYFNNQTVKDFAPDFLEAFNRMTESLEREIYNKQLHEKVLNDMSLTLKEIRDVLLKKPPLWKRLLLWKRK